MAEQQSSRVSSLTRSGLSAAGRRVEAERLIDLAKGMLTGPDEEMAVIYLDHALDSLCAIPTDAKT
jgi:hypothetical protein